MPARTNSRPGASPAAASPTPVDQPSAAQAAPEVVAYSVRTALRALNGCVGRNRLLKLIDAGEIPARRCGLKLVILREDLEAFLKRLPVRVGPQRGRGAARPSAAA